MLLLLLHLLSKPYVWTTDPTILAWISVASLIIGILGIIIGAFIGYWFYRKSKSLRRVFYEVISDTPIVTVREKTGRGKIKVTYEPNGGPIEEITNARLLTLKVRNAGNKDVNIWSLEDKGKHSLEIPIEFEFEGRRVVGLTHLETNPSSTVIQQEDLDEYLNSSLSPTSLGLPRCILKQNQALQLGVLLNGSKGSLKLKRGRILDGEVYSTEYFGKRKAWSYDMRMLAVMGVFAFLAFLAVVFSPATPLQIIFEVFFVLGFVVYCVVGIIRIRIDLRKLANEIILK